jgi:hypothetical protein
MNWYFSVYANVSVVLLDKICYEQEWTEADLIITLHVPIHFCHVMCILIIVPAEWHQDGSVHPAASLAQVGCCPRMQSNRVKARSSSTPSTSKTILNCESYYTTEGPRWSRLVLILTRGCNSGCLNCSFIFLLHLYPSIIISYWCWFGHILQCLHSSHNLVPLLVLFIS